MANIRELTLDREPEVPHILYDLGIDNIQDRKEKALRFASARKLGEYIGVVTRVVFENRQPGQRIYSPVLKKEFAARIEKTI